jgi:hypothetical protein
LHDEFQEEKIEKIEKVEKGIVPRKTRESCNCGCRGDSSKR